MQVNGVRRAADTFLNLYSKYERSPQMEYYGLGADSRKEDRTRYQLNTAAIDLRAGYRFTRALTRASTSDTARRTRARPTGRDDCVRLAPSQR